MALNKDELLAKFKKGEKITTQLLTDIAEFVEAQKGPKGDTGAKGNPGTPGADGAKGDKGDTGAKGNPGTPGADGVGIKSVVFTKGEDGAITGGTATLTDNTTIAITVE